MSDQRLLQLAGQGDADAFAALMAPHRANLVRATSARVGHSGAEDIVQETLLRAFLAVRAGDRPANVEAWLHVVARNVSVDAHRRGLRTQTSLLHPGVRDTGPAVEDAVAARDEFKAVLSALEELPERQRQALLSVTFSGTSYADVAHQQQTTVSAVKSLVNRARVRVRSAAAALTPPSAFPIDGHLLTTNRAGGGVLTAWAAKLTLGAAVSAVGVVVWPGLGLPPVHPASPAAVAHGLRQSPSARAATRALPPTTRPGPAPRPQLSPGVGAITPTDRRTDGCQRRDRHAGLRRQPDPPPLHARSPHAGPAQPPRRRLGVHRLRHEARRRRELTGSRRRGVAEARAPRRARVDFERLTGARTDVDDWACDQPISSPRRAASSTIA